VGGSHGGKIAAVDLAREALLGILLASAVHTVTKAPAEAVRRADRGEGALGKRADLIRIDEAVRMPVARSVWREES
jgi:alpha-D-ribose 1-methylphosphonate 5-triphosphate diphosphatase